MVGSLSFLRKAGMLQTNITFPMLFFLIAFSIFSSGEAAKFKPVEKRVSPIQTKKWITLQPTNYKLSISIDPHSDNFMGNVSMDFKIFARSKIIRINACDLIIMKMSVNNQKYDKTLEIKTKTFDEKAELYIVTMKDYLEEGSQYSLNMTYSGFLRNDQTGFYKGSYKEDDGTKQLFVTTRFEPYFARRAFPCLDEPRFGTNFYVTLIVPKGYTALFNSPLRKKYDDKDWSVFTFYSSPLMSTYSLAMLVSTFHNVSNKENTIRVHSRKSLFKKNWVDFALATANSTEKYFRHHINYTNDINKLDIVGIPDEYFPFAPTDNWGLFITKESSIFFKENETSTNEIQRVLTSITHHVTHHWVGNFAWKYTWLNEGVATFFQLYAPAERHPSWRMMDQFAVKIVQPAMIMDSILDASLISWSPEENTDEHSPLSRKLYFKAASVVRMIYHFLTPEIFNKGLKFYVSKNFSSTRKARTIFDALQYAIVQDNVYDLLGNKTIKDVITSWDANRGFPLVKASRDYDTGMITLSQTKFSYYNNSMDDIYVWTIPISYVFSSRAPNFHTATVDTWLTTRELEIPHATTKGWIILNKNVTSYYRVDYDETNWKRLSEFLDSVEFEKIPPVNRAQLIDDSFNLARAGKLSYAVPFSIVRYLRREIDYIPWYTFFTNLNFIKEKMFSHPEYEDFKKYIRNLYDHLFYLSDFVIYSEDSHLERLKKELLSKWMCSTGDKRCINHAMYNFRVWMHNSHYDIHPDLQTAYFCGAVSAGGAKHFDFLLDSYRNTTKDKANLRKRFIVGMGCTTEEDLMRKYVNEALNKSGIFEEDDKLAVFESLYTQSHAGLKFVLEYFAEYDSKKLDEQVDIKTILMGITRFISTDELMMQLQNVTKNLGPDASYLKDVSKEANKNLDWVKEHKDDLIAQIYKNKVNQICSNTTIFLIFYVMTMLF